MNIALTGALRSGKDTVAAYLHDNYGYTQFAFGDGLKDVCRRLYPNQFAVGTKPRALLQGFGQMARSFDENVWVNECFRAIERECWVYDEDGAPWFEIDGFRAVISDLRQPSEYERCRAEGFVIIRVKAKSALRIHRAVEAADTFSLADLTHQTEQYTDTFAVDYDVTNDGTLDELYAQIDEVMNSLTARSKAEVVRD